MKIIKTIFDHRLPFREGKEEVTNNMQVLLPPELWLKIFSLLSPRDLAAAACVCRYKLLVNNICRYNLLVSKEGICQVVIPAGNGEVWL